MKQNSFSIKLFFVILLLSGLVIPANLVFAKASNHKQVTQDLITLLKDNPEIKTMLEASIAEAKKGNPDPKTNPVQNLADYYNYIDSAVELIPQNELECSNSIGLSLMGKLFCLIRFFHAPDVQRTT